MSDLEGAGWFFLEPASVPQRWRHRAVPVMMIRLLPDEAKQVLRGHPPVPGMDATDERLAPLVAAGLSNAEIGRELGISARTVQRRVARLRRQLDADSKAELARTLIRHGY